MNNFWNTVSRRRFLFLSSGALLGSTFLKGCSTAPSNNSSASPGGTGGGELLHQDEASLYEAAKKEGKLVYYTVFFNQDVVNEIGAAFTKKYPGIQFEGTRKVAGTLFQQLSQEIQSGIKTCDVFGTTDVGQMLKLKGGQKLVTYEPEGKDKIREDFRNLDPDNAFQTGAIIPIVIGYNTQKMKVAEAPKAWADLIKPGFKDKIATGSGAASGQVGTWAIAMDEKFGWDKYFPPFSKLNPKLGRSINDAVSDVVSGERSVGIGTLGQFLTQKAKGNPVEVVYPTEGAVVVVGPIGILKDSPHPNAAKLFLNFLMSKEYAELAAKYHEQPLRADVTVKDAKPLAEMKPIIPTVEAIKVGIPQIKKKWQNEFGA
jgi:iron(III) transport system substrate-binding protein